MNRLWLLVPVALACKLLFPPLDLTVSGGSALYAHRTGNLALRNSFVAYFILIAVFTAVLRSRPNLQVEG